MGVRRKLNIGNQAHPAAWHNFSIRLFQRKLEMGRLDLSGSLPPSIRGKAFPSHCSA